MKRLVTLWTVVLVAGVLTGLLARVWHPAPPAAARPAPAPVASLALTLEQGAVTPEFTSIPKDHRVKLSITNHIARTVTLSLTGYEDRLHAVPIPPDSTRTAEFVADRPGEGFTWLVDGAPLGRLDVTGSHLMEGHR